MYRFTSMLASFVLVSAAASAQTDYPDPADHRARPARRRRARPTPWPG